MFRFIYIYRWIQYFICIYIYHICLCIYLLYSKKWYAMLCLIISSSCHTFSMTTIETTGNQPVPITMRSLHIKYSIFIKHVRIYHVPTHLRPIYMTQLYSIAHYTHEAIKRNNNNNFAFCSTWIYAGTISKNFFNIVVYKNRKQCKKMTRIQNNHDNSIGKPENKNKTTDQNIYLHRLPFPHSICQNYFQ